MSCLQLPCETSTNTHTDDTPIHTSGSLRHTRPDTASPSGPPTEDHPQAPAGEGGGGPPHEVAEHGSRRRRRNKVALDRRARAVDDAGLADQEDAMARESTRIWYVAKSILRYLRYKSMPRAAMRDAPYTVLSRRPLTFARTHWWVNEVRSLLSSLTPSRVRYTGVSRWACWHRVPKRHCT